MDRNEVHVALEILVEELEIVANGLDENGTEAFKTGEYDKATEASEMAARLSDFRDKVKTLQQDWSNLFVHRIVRRSTRRKRGRVAARLQQGLRTPEHAYRRPILDALVELGGRVALDDVLDRVGDKMKDTLNEYDHQPLRSNDREKRWRNTVKWCRNDLVREGLMESGSSQGIWEISDRGREALRLGQV
jgi:hypothetical protein